MEKIVVDGGRKLEGECCVQGSKNASLPIIGATILTGGENVLHMCPILKDTITACEILNLLGCKTVWVKGKGWGDEKVDMTMPSCVINSIEDLPHAIHICTDDV